MGYFRLDQRDYDWPTDQRYHPLAMLACLTIGIVWKPHQQQIKLHLKYTSWTTVPEDYRLKPALRERDCVLCNGEISHYQTSSCLNLPFSMLSFSHILYKTLWNNIRTRLGLRFEFICVVCFIFNWTRYITTGSQCTGAAVKTNLH